ncbi:hypothetical protein HGRIS_012853 [Hohenbuehelia grisea]|uniref:DUF6699 domain-containing protein n=1 Tax=Hohenbuehelia grisea TaxID=104357 RepID=A0ABR3ITS3_9AGAR
MAAAARRERWQIYGGQYRQVTSLDQPWRPSPLLSSWPLDLPWNRLPLPLDNYPPSPPTSSSSSGPHTPPLRASLLRSIRVLKRLLPGSPRRRISSESPLATSPARELGIEIKTVNDRVPLSEWKAYGYFACPFVNGMNVYNESPGPPGVTPNIDEVYEAFESLTRDDSHWIRGTQHIALPPRPTRWAEPNPLDPLPFPFECQLNPHLEHKLFGTPPLIFNIGLHPGVILYAGVDVTLPLLPSDKAQPATYPFLTHMFINAVADDPMDNFPWPIMVVQELGIKVADVLNAIYHNFQEHVSRTEYDSWPPARRKQAAAARTSRIAASNGTVPEDDTVRRIDYLGDLVMFRGLQANPDISTSSWVISVGRVWS